MLVVPYLIILALRIQLNKIKNILFNQLVEFFQYFFSNSFINNDWFIESEFILLRIKTNAQFNRNIMIINLYINYESATNEFIHLMKKKMLRFLIKSFHV